MTFTVPRNVDARVACSNNPEVKLQEMSPWNKGRGDGEAEAEEVRGGRRSCWFAEMILTVTHTRN